MRKWVTAALALLACGLVSAGAGAALGQSQATTGVIEGTVTDSIGQVLPGATINLLNTDTNFTREVFTDARGRFRAVLLPLGSYRVKVSLEGFQSETRDGIELTLGETIILRFKLNPAAG